MFKQFLNENMPFTVVPSKIKQLYPNAASKSRQAQDKGRLMSMTTTSEYYYSDPLRSVNDMAYMTTKGGVKSRANVIGQNRKTLDQLIENNIKTSMP